MTINERIFPITDHLQCGNKDCFYDGKWCYHLTDKNWQDMLDVIKSDLCSLLDDNPITKEIVINYFK